MNCSAGPRRRSSQPVALAIFEQRAPLALEQPSLQRIPKGGRGCRTDSASLRLVITTRRAAKQRRLVRQRRLEKLAGIRQASAGLISPREPVGTILRQDGSKPTAGFRERPPVSVLREAAASDPNRNEIAGSAPRPPCSLPDHARDAGQKRFRSARPGDLKTYSAGRSDGNCTDHEAPG